MSQIVLRFLRVFQLVLLYLGCLKVFQDSLQDLGFVFSQRIWREGLGDDPGGVVCWSSGTPSFCRPRRCLSTAPRRAQTARVRAPFAMRRGSRDVAVPVSSGSEALDIILAGGNLFDEPPSTVAKCAPGLAGVASGRVLYDASQILESRNVNLIVITA